MILSKIQDSPNVNWFAFGKRCSSAFPDVIKTFMGRDALGLYLWNMKREEEVKTALIPAYTCNEVIDQFRKHGFEILFYDMCDFHLDIDVLMRSLRNHKIDVFYFIHYFGIVQSNMGQILKALKQFSPAMHIVEDRAHYLSNRLLYPEVDAIIYSFRKLMPIPEGGGVLASRKLEYCYRPSWHSNLLALAMPMKKVLFGHNPKFSRSKMLKGESILTNEVLPPSVFSKKIVDSFDVVKQTDLRRRLFVLWIDKLSLTSIMPVYDALKPDDIPQGCPIYVADAEVVQREMDEKGIYLKRHWPIDPEYKLSASGAYALSERVITLPIYEGIEEKDMEGILQMLQQVGGVA
ncbi:MAG: hypothetical protein P8Y49_07960 [Sulfurovaceae bacterium]